ncbi:MAG: choice-of-anchor D domain-containing protein [Gaiellaceae bacterium]
MSHRTIPRPLLAALVTLAAFVMLAVAGPAFASVVKAGPINPQTGFPAWYEDGNGVRLEPCVASVANCFLGGTVPKTGQPFSVPGNSPDELFYYDVDSTMTSAGGGIAFLRVALEGGFSSASGGPEPGKQAVFARVRVRVDNLVPGATYTVTHPWGVETLVAGPSARRSINFTTDVGCPVVAGSPPCDFNLALAGAVGPFFSWDAGAPAGFLGSFGTPHTLQSAGLVPNVFRIEGPDVGGPGINMIETDQFQLNAKVAGALIASPAVFGAQRVGAAASTPQTVTVTNTSPDPVKLGAAALAGANAADFAVTADTCSNKTIDAGSTCSAAVTFQPAAAGSRLATLSFDGDDLSVLLSGTGTAPVLSFGLGVTSLPFGSQRIGTTMPHPVVITNDGTASLTFTGATLAGPNVSELAVGANGCLGLALSPGGTCTISVEFSPTTVGQKTAELRVADDAAGSPHTLPISGTGTVPVAVLSGSSLTFAAQPVGTMSDAQVVSIGNSGTTTLLVGAVRTDGANASDFQVSGCAGATVLPGSTCAVNVRFAPTAGGGRDAALLIADDTGTHSVALHGIGVAAPTQAAVPAQPAASSTPATAAPQAIRATPAAQPSQPSAPTVKKKQALLRLLRGVHITRAGRFVVIRGAVALGAPGTVDVGVAIGTSRLALQKNSRLGAFHAAKRMKTLSARVRSAGTVAIVLRLAKGSVHSGRLVRVVVHARGAAGAVSIVRASVRL